MRFSLGIFLQVSYDMCKELIFQDYILGYILLVERS